MIHRYQNQKKSHCKSLLSLSNSQFFTEPFSSLDSIFLPAWYDSHGFIREANFRFFTWRCIFVRSSLFSLFRTGPRSLPWFMFTYKIIELHLIRKMLGLTMLINWVEVSSQSIRGIHYRWDSCESCLGWLHTLYRAVNQEGTLTSGHNIKPPFLRQYLVFFNFFSEIRDYSSTITLTQKSKFEETYRSEGILQP